MAANNYILDGSANNNKGLVVNGGKVDAEYITGDVNGKITVNGGIVSRQIKSAFRVSCMAIQDMSR